MTGEKKASAAQPDLNKRKCPSCKMPGWDGINLHRERLAAVISGCPCCGFCY